MVQTVPSRVKQVRCACGKWFWAWDSNRDQCRQCKPDHPVIARIVQKNVNEGSIHL